MADPETPAVNGPVQSVEVVVAVLPEGESVPAEDLALLDREELGRADAFATPILRARYARSHAFLRRVVGGRVGREPASLAFERTCEHCADPTHGRPRLAGAPSGPGAFAFNLSHSDRYVAVATGPGPLGVDIEAPDRRPVSLAVMRRSCGPYEWHRLQRLAGTAQQEAFYGIWTRKEAVAKAVGLGLVLGFGTFEVEQPGPVVARPGLPPVVTTVVTTAGATVAVASPPGVPVEVRLHTPPQT